MIHVAILYKFQTTFSRVVMGLVFGCWQSVKLAPSVAYPVGRDGAISVGWFVEPSVI